MQYFSQIPDEFGTLSDKIVYYGDKKAKVVERLNETQYKVSYDKDKRNGVMKYDEIILTFQKTMAPNDLVEESIEERQVRNS